MGEEDSWLLTTAHLSDCEEYHLLLIPLSPQAGPFRDRDGSRYIGRMGACICVRHRELGGLVNVLACPGVRSSSDPRVRRPLCSTKIARWAAPNHRDNAMLVGIDPRMSLASSHYEPGTRRQVFLLQKQVQFLRAAGRSQSVIRVGGMPSCSTIHLYPSQAKDHRYWRPQGRSTSRSFHVNSGVNATKRARRQWLGWEVETLRGRLGAVKLCHSTRPPDLERHFEINRASHTMD